MRATVAGQVDSLRPKIADSQRPKGAVFLAAALVGVALVPRVALAQGDNIELARESFSDGQEKFDKGEYDAAKEAFLRSLDAFPHFRTIFNVALCEEKLGNLAAAIEMYERYRDWPSEVPNRDEVSAKIAELRGQLPPEETVSVEEDEPPVPEDASPAEGETDEAAPTPAGSGQTIGGSSCLDGSCWERVPRERLPAACCSGWPGRVRTRCAT